MRTTSKARQIAIDTDTALAAQYEELAKLARTQTAAYSTLHRAIGDRRIGLSRWALTDETAYFEASHKVDEAEDATGQIERALENLVAIETDIDLVNERIAELDRVYADHGGWNRYFLVTNNNGHVHRGMGCSTCFPTTEYAWLIELADCDEDAMIVDYGEKACTVCFPSAPANPHFSGPGRLDREAVAARQAEKDARQVAKDAKRLDPQGEVFKTEYMRDRIETVAACKDVIRKAVDTAEELKVISTAAFAARWTGDSDQLARLISNVTDHLAQQERDAEEATRVLLAREARHEGWGATQAQVDKIIASKAKSSAKAWATA